MTADIEKLDARGYRKFGVTTGAIIIGLFGLVIPWLFNLNYPTWPWILGVAWAPGLCWRPRPYSRSMPAG